MGAGLLSGSQKSIIDRCTASVYQNYFHARGELPMPLLSDWRAEVLKQPDPEAQEIAPAAELITAHRSHGQSGSAAFCREQRTGENI